MSPPCLGSWILLATAAAQALGLPLHQGRPSCEELWRFWDALTSSGGEDEMSNHIPVMPAEVISLNDLRRVLDRGPPAPRKTLPLLPVPQQTPSKSETKLDPPAPQSGSVHHPFPPAVPPEWALEDLLPPLGRRPPPPAAAAHEKSGPEKKENLFEDWEHGEFGKFLDWDGDSAMFAGGPADGSPLLNAPLRTCATTRDMTCSTDEDCACAGRTMLACLRGKCLDLYNDREIGGWHDEALPYTSLGMNRRSKDNHRTIIM